MTHDDRTQLGEVQLLRRTIELALDNVTEGQEPFGALVVRDGEVLGTGVNSVGQDIDPTAHAEIAAVRAAARRLGTPDLTGATVYSSCEPCAMCHTVCAASGVSNVVYAAPKELVPALGGPTREALARMQATLRTTAGEMIRHLPVPGADEPFRRYVEMAGGQS
jgi:guanine deaminase